MQGSNNCLYSEIYCKTNMLNCAGGREPNTSTMFVQPFQHYAITICTTDANRLEKKDQML